MSSSSRSKSRCSSTFRQHDRTIPGPSFSNTRKEQSRQWTVFTPPYSTTLAPLHPPVLLPPSTTRDLIIAVATCDLASAPDLRRCRLCHHRERPDSGRIGQPLRLRGDRTRSRQAGGPVDDTACETQHDSDKAAAVRPTAPAAVCLTIGRVLTAPAARRGCRPGSRAG